MLHSCVCIVITSCEAYALHICITSKTDDVMVMTKGDRREGTYRLTKFKLRLFAIISQYRNTNLKQSCFGLKLALGLD